MTDPKVISELPSIAMLVFVTRSQATSKKSLTDGGINAGTQTQIPN